jgi:hypothetical protein
MHFILNWKKHLMWIFPSESHALSLEEADSHLQALATVAGRSPTELCALFTAHAKDELGYYHPTIKAAHMQTDRLDRGQRQMGRSSQKGSTTPLR